MKTKTRFFNSIIVTLLFILSGCSAEDGDVGPQGEQGIQGKTGEQGIQGPQGEPGVPGIDGEDGEDGADGEDGNANVFFSEWFDADWNERDDPALKIMRIPAEDLPVANSVLRLSFIAVYTRQFGTSSIYQMPTSGRWEDSVEYSYTFGGPILASGNFDGIRITLQSTDDDLTETQYAGFRGNRFRWVIIPHSSSVSSKNGNSILELDYSDYEAVKSFYTIPD
ncbi:MAG: hypothetical protein ACFB0A_10840 [Croceivirga sp.]